MTSKRYWQLYDACVKAMAKRMRVSEKHIHTQAMLKTTPDNVYDPHKRLQLVWRSWQCEERYPARWSLYH